MSYIIIFSLMYLHALRLIILQTGLSQNRFITKTGLFQSDPPPCWEAAILNYLD